MKKNHVDAKGGALPKALSTVPRVQRLLGYESEVPGDVPITKVMDDLGVGTWAQETEFMENLAEALKSKATQQRIRTALPPSRQDWTKEPERISSMTSYFGNGK